MPHSQLLPDSLNDDPDDGQLVIPGLPILIGNSDDLPAPSEEREEPVAVLEYPPPRPDAVPILDNARRAFTEYAGSREPSTLRRSFNHYVRDGLGGTRKAGARMARSSAAANSVALFLRDVQNRGIERVLQELHLEELVGRSAQEIFAGVIDAICPNVESIDDALAREALLDTVLEFNEMGSMRSARRPFRA